MNRRMARLSGFLFAAVFALAGAAAAQTSVKAASCSQADVQSAISQAQSGDTILIPPGTCTWTTGITTSGIGVSIIGAGAGSTVIVDGIASNSSASSALFYDRAVPYGQLMRFSSMTIEPESGDTNMYSPIVVIGACTAAGCPNLRVDHVDFNGWSQANNGGQSAWLTRVDDMFGVMDHNTITAGTGGEVMLVNDHFSSYLGVGQYGDNSWAAPDSFGTPNALFIENNTFQNGASTNDCDESDLYADAGGCRLVVRFNTYAGIPGELTMIAGDHGTESTGRPRGGRSIAAYGNTLTCADTSQGCASLVGMRSGVTLMFGNKVTLDSGAWVTTFLALDDYRTFASFTPWGSCDGTSPYDDDDGTVYASGTFGGVGGASVLLDGTKNWAPNQWVDPGDPYSIVDTTQGWGAEITSNSADTITWAIAPVTTWSNQTGGVWHLGDSYEILRASVCLDQPSRSGGGLLSGDPPSPAGWVGEVLDPSYEWDDTEVGAGPTHGTVSADTARLIVNRDWYTDNSNGSPQVQTSPTSPFNGSVTPGTASDGIGIGPLADRPATCTPRVAYWATDQGNWNQSNNGFGQGELFVCTAANTWTLDFTPYTYPHPLTTENNPPAAPSSLTATVN